MNLSIRESASADLANIHAWIAKDSSANAASVVSRILDAMDHTILQNPYIGRAGKAHGTREWVVRNLPYVIVYEVDDSRQLVTVLAVQHSAQRR